MRAAIYSRFSTDRQNPTSIADQVRVCTEYAERQGWQVLECYSDEGISGEAMGNRPRFLKMREAAMARRFDVLLVMDTTRLARSQDLAPLVGRLRYQGVRVIGVQDAFDSVAGTADMQAGLSGIMSVEFRRMVRARTHAALESRAQAGRSAGGRPYGYIPPAISGTGKVEIDAAQAEVVRRIFTMYADGISAKRIAEILNRGGVPSPGSSWSRTTRRRGGWAPSAIAGDPSRGIGILNNELYAGRGVWNRSKWIKDPDTGRRQAVQRPRSEWIVREAPELRIVDAGLWAAVKARQERQQRDRGEAVRRGLKRGTGRAARYLFSSVLQCKVCGSNYVQRGATRYVCSAFENGRVCSNGQTFRRDVMEAKLLAAIREQLLSDASVEKFKARLLRRLRRPPADGARIKKLEAEIQRMVDAIALGMRPRALLERLQASEGELERLKDASRVVDVEAVMAAIPRAVTRYRIMVGDLGNAPIDVEQGREIIRGIAARIPVRPGADGVPIAELSLNEEMPLAGVAIGGSDIGMVAGAGFEPATFGL